MTGDIIKYIISFIIYALLQVLVVGNIPWGWFMNPFIYIAFIILLPLQTPGWLLLTSGFLMGMTIDFFGNTPGMHTLATLTVSYIRTSLHAAIIPREDYSFGTRPDIATFGFPWFIKYVVLMVLLHHLVLFFVEAFTFSFFFSTMFKVLASTIVSTLLILISQLFSTGKNKNR